MAQKFHIDRNGNPAVCRATKRACPLGGDDVHFDSMEEAQAYADEQNEAQFGLLGGVSTYKGDYIDDGFGNLRVSTKEILEGGEFKDHLARQMEERGGFRDKNGNEMSPEESMRLLEDYAKKVDEEYTVHALDYFDEDTVSVTRVQIFDYNEPGVDGSVLDFTKGMTYDAYSDYSDTKAINRLQEMSNRNLGEDIPVIKGHKDSLFGVDGKAPFNSEGRVAKGFEELRFDYGHDDSIEEYDKFVWHGARKNILENPKAFEGNKVYPGFEGSTVIGIFHGENW